MSVRSPVQGLVKEVHVKKGDAVSKDQVLATLSIMKMLHPVLSANGGMVTNVYVASGQVVDKGDVLLSIDRRLMYVKVLISNIDTNHLQHTKRRHTGCSDES
jgi:multidrug efflux pump subunit AcrA (membrane-fusion protein)